MTHRPTDLPRRSTSCTSRSTQKPAGPGFNQEARLALQARSASWISVYHHIPPRRSRPSAPRWPASSSQTAARPGGLDVGLSQDSETEAHEAHDAMPLAGRRVRGRGRSRDPSPFAASEKRAANMPMTFVFGRVVWRVVLAAIRFCRAQVLACAACACVPVSAGAAVSPRDAAATRAYLHIEADQARVADSDLGMGVAAVEALERQVAGECPGALAFAPRDIAYEEIGDELRIRAVDHV
jgi:hypothetical protein